MLDLERNSLLPFPLPLKDGRTIETVSDVADFLSLLTEDQRERVHWRTAILMLNNAMRESRYLKIAIINLRSALAYDDLLAQDAP
ncbi:hypothetical protein [Bradyrhizobium cenepequi]|uniref:hypothetical protein n=1 Tax=Bradyrhizobium cenepequi TaxID=2821403 RepID=UPI001CE28483|nr:hypothetical protein [Bradyrhizobium cenepequi]MCA6107683.1 hypothetical protein [Bradyrhizobium cenepequi]